jgi:glutathione S-transferase
VATKPEFPAISPNNRIRAIVDNSPSDVGHRYPNRARSSYILLKTGKFLPRDLLGRIEVIEWLFWQIGGLGPMAPAFVSFSLEFEMFRPDLDAALAYSDGAQGGRPPFDPVMMFKVLVI